MYTLKTTIISEKKDNIINVGYFFPPKFDDIQSRSDRRIREEKDTYLKNKN